MEPGLENLDNVISLDEFRKRHPVPSGRLIRKKDRKQQIVDGAPTKVKIDEKIKSALAKFGSWSGKAMSKQFKNKIEAKDGDI